MRMLLGLSAAIDAMTAFIGRAVSWFILATVLISAGNAIVRKAFDISSNAWLELQWYLFGAVFLLASAYTLQRNDHIRIDIVTGVLPKGLRNFIDVLGHIFMLLPFSILMVYESLGFVRQSYLQQENSPNAGGLILWPAKALILAGFFLLFLQGLSELIKRIAVMAGLISDPYVSQASLDAESLSNPSAGQSQ